MKNSILDCTEDVTCCPVCGKEAPDIFDLSDHVYEHSPEFYKAINYLSPLVRITALNTYWKDNHNCGCNMKIKLINPRYQNHDFSLLLFTSTYEAWQALEEYYEYNYLIGELKDMGWQEEYYYPHKPS